MANKRKRAQTQRRIPPKRRKKMKGGQVPFVVDFKKGFELLTDKRMWSVPSKADYKKADKQVRDYKRQYRTSGAKESFDKWAIKKGYAEKSACILM